MTLRRANFIKIAVCAAVTALAFAGARPANAQVPTNVVFDVTDWPQDRGGVLPLLGPPPPLPPGNSLGVPQALRPGYVNYFNDSGSFPNSFADPKQGNRYWVFPQSATRTIPADITGNTIPWATDPKGLYDGVVVDNVNAAAVAAGKQQFLPTIGANLLNAPIPTMAANDKTNGTNSWVIASKTQQTTFGGFSFTADSTLPGYHDYLFAKPIHNDFIVTHQDGTTAPATSDELALLPNADPHVYKAVDNVLTANAGEADAVWTSGSLGTTANRFGIQIYSPGDGTNLDDGTGNFQTHPNLQNTFVRVSWGAVADDPLTSRIFLADLSTSGWIDIAGTGKGPASIPYDGTNPITVTLYTLTPDDPTNTAVYLRKPVVTADAVRFYSQINAGRILGPTVTAKLPKPNPTVNPPAVPVNDTYYFFAREEQTADTTLRSRLNPDDPNSAAAVDPTAVVTSPVFYCIDNQPTYDPLTNNLIPSGNKLRWRYVAAPEGGSGTEKASPYIANVRAQWPDAVTGINAFHNTTMVYFLTTNVDGTLGHVYALDAFGDPNYVINNAVTTGTTWAYWSYPSIRPILATDAVVYPNITLPASLHDPNVADPANIRAALLPYYIVNSAYYVPVIAGGPAVRPNYVPANDAARYDGVLAKNAQNHPIVRADTVLPVMGGITGSPVVIDDPLDVNSATPQYPQMLVIGDNNGRLFAFDAGGRGDYHYDSTSQNTDFSKNYAGTTQRLWTWPRFGVDKWLAKGSLVTPRDPKLYPDDPSKTGFPVSPAFDRIPQTGGTVEPNSPVLVTAADGHLYAVNPAHDNFAITNFNRLSWQYPADAISLGSQPSTPSVFRPTGFTITPTVFGYVYFTVGGRVYSVTEASPTSVSATPATVSPLYWVYPFTDNIPNPSETPANPNSADPNQTTAAFDPGFNGTAPITVQGSAIQSSPGTGVTPPDLVYATLGNGTLLALNAAPTVAGTKTTLYAAGSSLSGANVRSSPILTSLIPQQFYDAADNAVTTERTAVLFGDDAGGLWGFRADGIAPGTVTPKYGATNLLKIIWSHEETAWGRSAAPIVGGATVYKNTIASTGGVIVIGDGGGTLRAYSGGVDLVGNLPGRTGDSGEGGAEPEFGFSSVSIDIRGVDFYNAADWANFMQPAGAADKTPARNNVGAPYTGSSAASADPMKSPLDSTLTGPILADWGGNLYIAVYGVYHAHLQNIDVNTGVPVLATQQPVPPNISVTFRVTQPGVSNNSQTFVVNVPHTSRDLSAFNDQFGNPFGIYSWPDDNGISAADHVDVGANAISIMDADGLTLLKGAQSGTFPWVARIKIPINPDRLNPFIPGLGGYQVTALANITQELVLNGTVYMRMSNYSGTMQVGQRDVTGKSVNPTLSPEKWGNSRLLGITNPLGLSVRNYVSTDMTGGSNVIGWAPSIEMLASTNLAGVQEVAGNGNRLINILGTVSKIKAPFAPVGLIPDGGQAIYGVLPSNGGNNPVPGFCLVDRSNLAQSKGTPLTVRMFTRPLRWHGDYTSVMNALPWDQLPSDAGGTVDYPNIPASNMSLRIGGQDLTAIRVSLTPPNYPANIDPDVSIINRTPIPTVVDYSVTVPTYQPANVNRGVVVYGGHIFGSSYTGIDGVARGKAAGGVTTATPILGPLAQSNGQIITKTTQTYPAAGYVAELLAVAEPSYAGGAANSYGADVIFSDAGSLDGATVANKAYRAFETGVCVPARLRMRVLEETLDLGKLPAGAGYSQGKGAGAYQYQFSPTMVGPTSTYNSPWDVNGQSFFLPFTLLNESNVNMVQVTVAKQSGFAGGTPESSVLVSDSVDNLYVPAHWDAAGTYVPAQWPSAPPLAGLRYINPTAGLVGNIGMVSSFDHDSSTGADYSLYPVKNNFVTTDVFNESNLLGIGWTLGAQPYPTVHKPRANDVSGVVATVPDIPYGASAVGTASPKIGIAIPFGTPVGTYSNPVYVFEDNTPYQWHEWVSFSQQVPANDPSFGVDRDGVLNMANLNPKVPSAGAVKASEAYTDPTFTLKVRVVESRLTQGATRGSLPVVDTSDFGAANVLPTAMRVNPTNNGTPDLWFYWASNRLSGGTAPSAVSPWNLYYSSIASSALPTTDALLAAMGADYSFNSVALWSTGPAQFATSADYPTLNGLTLQANTARNGSPALAQAQVVSGASVSTGADTYLFWQGAADYATAGGMSQYHSFTFYAPVTNGIPGAPLALLNDTRLPKMGPKPLFVEVNGGPSLVYLFWYAVRGGHSALYYNVGNITNAVVTWSADTLLPIPKGLDWAGEPSPIFRLTPDANGNALRCVDVVYTGQFKSRRNNEAVLGRYQINFTAPVNAGDPALYALAPMLLPQVEKETLSRVGNTAVWTARDAAWVFGTGTVQIYRIPKGGAAQLISNGAGSLDPQTGNITFNSALGGRVVVDPGAGTVSFPQIRPDPSDAVQASYTPQLMRLVTNRDEPNIVGGAFGNFGVNDVAFTAHPALSTFGNNTAPVPILDRTQNPRQKLTSPPVVKYPSKNWTAGMEIDRLWLLYRKSDPASAINGSIFYKTLRLVVNLPRPLALNQVVKDANNNFLCFGYTLNVSGNKGPVEVDWARGRLFFTEADEGNVVSVSYDYLDANKQVQGSGGLQYRVAWGDEMGVTGQMNQESVHEVMLPTDGTVNEGQVAAFKDPLAQKLWVFWSSTRNGRTDLYSETLAPQFYSTSTYQK